MIGRKETKFDVGTCVMALYGRWTGCMGVVLELEPNFSYDYVAVFLADWRTAHSEIVIAHMSGFTLLEGLSGDLSYYRRDE